MSFRSKILVSATNVPTFVYFLPYVVNKVTENSQKLLLSAQLSLRVPPLFINVCSALLCTGEPALWKKAAMTKKKQKN